MLGSIGAFVSSRDIYTSSQSSGTLQEGLLVRAVLDAWDLGQPLSFSDERVRDIHERLREGVLRAEEGRHPQVPFLSSPSLVWAGERTGLGCREHFALVSVHFDRLTYVVLAETPGTLESLPLR